MSAASVWSMDPSETASTLTELVRAEARIVELKARVAAHADEARVGSEVAASSTANWLAHTTKATRAEAYRTVKLGQDLEAHPLTREALAAGDLHVEQAKVVVRWVDRLPPPTWVRTCGRSSPRTRPTLVRPTCWSSRRRSH